MSKIDCTLHTCTTSISVITKGKYAILEASALEKLLPLLSDINSEVRLNAIKALTLLAEAPKAKVRLQSCLTKVRTCSQTYMYTLDWEICIVNVFVDNLSQRKHMR